MFGEHARDFAQQERVATRFRVHRVGLLRRPVQTGRRQQLPDRARIETS